MEQFPELHTENYYLRAFRENDIDEVFRALSHPAVIKHYGISYKTKTATKEQMDWFKRIVQEDSGIWWAIESRRARGVLLGSCGVNSWSHVHNKAEMGYWLLPEYWKQGVMRECVPAIINYLFTQTRLRRIEATVEVGNERSGQLLLRNGFSHEGTLRESEFKNGKYISVEYYGLLKSEV